MRVKVFCVIEEHVEGAVGGRIGLKGETKTAMERRSLQRHPAYARSQTAPLTSLASGLPGPFRCAAFGTTSVCLCPCV